MYSRAELRFMLIFVEDHIRQGNEHIAAMERLVGDGERDGFNMGEARFVLAGFQTAQTERQRQRTHLLRSLGDLD